MARALRLSPLTPVNALGRLVLRLMTVTGALTLFTLSGLVACLTPRWYPRQIGQQIIAVGFMSLPVIGLTAIFTGAALALNIYTGGARFNADQVVPQIVALGITRELAPVLTALMLAGRVAATIAAEIGAMRSSEQIEAMRSLSTDPFRYLIAPRVIAGILTLPMLTAVADAIGIAGGWLVSTLALDFNPTIYARATVEFLEPWDVESGLIKGAVFGLIVTVMGCYHGYRAVGGARGVGRAATAAMVWSGILIFAADYALTTAFTQ